MMTRERANFHNCVLDCTSWTGSLCLDLLVPLCCLRHLPLLVCSFMNNALGFLPEEVRSNADEKEYLSTIIK